MLDIVIKVADANALSQKANELLGIVGEILPPSVVASLMPLLRTAAEVALSRTFLTAVAVAIIMAVARGGYLWYRRKTLRNRVLKSKTSRIRIVAHRNLCTALVVSPQEGNKPPVGRTMSSYIQQWLKELEFGVTVIDDLSVLSEAVDFTPTVTAVDCRAGIEIAKKVDTHFQLKGIPSNATVVLFNLPTPSENFKTKYLSNVTLLGRSFSRGDIVRTVTPLLFVEETDVLPPPSDLQGRLSDNTLSDILQFMESGGRTGVIVLRDVSYRIVGTLRVEQGMIVHGHHHSGLNGENAVMKLLEMFDGYFQIGSTESDSYPANCMLPPTAALLQGAKLADEQRSGIASPGFQS